MADLRALHKKMIAIRRKNNQIYYWQIEIKYECDRLIGGESGKRIFGGSLYYSCTSTVRLKFP